MSSLAIASTMFGCILTGMLASMKIARHLPGHHLSDDSKEVVKLGLGVVGTLTAMVLGLLVSATKGTFDEQSGTIKDVAAQVAMVDRTLFLYGKEAEPARAQLRHLTQSILTQIWPTDKSGHVDFSGGQSRHTGEQLFEAISKLEPTTDTQRMLKSRAQDILTYMGQLRQKLVVNDERSIPPPLLIVLGVWQAVLFAGFGLLTPRNATAITVIVICMLSVSGALFIVMELDRPFSGIVRVSDAPLQVVASHLGE